MEANQLRGVEEGKILRNGGRGGVFPSLCVDLLFFGKGSEGVSLCFRAFLFVFVGRCASEGN